MKLFQKRRDDTGMEQRGSPGADYRLDNNAKHNFDKAGIYHGDKIPAFHQDLILPSTQDEQQMLNIAMMRNAPTLIGNDSPKNRQSIAGLVRKLNCSSSSKKNDEAFNQYTYPAGVGGVAELVGFSGDQRETKGGSSNKVSTSAILSDITRPVLITVKDSDANPSSTQSGRKSKSNNHSPTETGNTFVVGGVPSRTSSSRLGMSARKRQHNEKENNKNRGGGIIMGNTSNHNRSKNNHTTSKDPDTKRTAQELARRQRWKRGLEMELFRNSSIAKRSNGRDIPVDDESWADSVTQGSQTTSSSYDDTTENSSSVDDWTDSTDESRVYPRRHQYRHGSSNTGGQQCLQNEKIARSLAKDVGIIASFLMADGYACLGTAAEITKETVASCRRNGL